MTWKLFCVISVFLLGILAASIVNSANAAEHVRVQRDIQDRIQVDFFKNNHTSQTLFPPFLVKDISPGPKGTIPAGQAVVPPKSWTPSIINKPRWRKGCPDAKAPHIYI